MINITFDPITGAARLAAAATIKLGADVPVQIVFATAPGDVSSLQLALGTDSTAPAVLAFTETFTAENDTTWTALLDAADTRLVAYMAGKGPVPVSAELVAVIDGVRQVAPNLQVTVQPRIIDGPGTTEGGPTYLTEAQIAALYATRSALAAAITWTVITGAHAAVAGEKLAANTTAAAFTVTLPLAPVVGTEVQIRDAQGTAAAHNITVARNGQLIAAVADALLIDVNNASIALLFVGGATGWALYRLE